MEASTAQSETAKLVEEFTGLTVLHVSDAAALERRYSATGRFTVDEAGTSQLCLHREDGDGGGGEGEGTSDRVVRIDPRNAHLYKTGAAESLCVIESSEREGDEGEKSFSTAITIAFRKEDERNSFHDAFQQHRSGVIGAVSGTYYAAVMENNMDFHDRVVVDVGAGSGILSLFAAQAGARHVYAVEASEMAAYAQKLVAGNPSLSERITIVKGKIEDVILPEKADILISEPMGTLLINERMLETYIIARDRFLVPHGKMFPMLGRIHMAPFSDEYLFVEIANKSLFWQQQNYFGVDLTSLCGSAFQGYFSQPVVDAFDPRLLISPAVFHTLDFTCIKEEELYEIDIPFCFKAAVGTRVHGLACWFDVLFNGSSVQRWLTTAPGAPTTHWYQIRCVLQQPLYVMAGQEITGKLHMVAHNAQSYTIHLTMSSKMWGPGAEQGGILQTSSGKFDLKEPYYRMSQPQAYTWAQQDQQPQQTLQPQASQDIPLQSQDGDGPGIVLPMSESPDAALIF